MFLTGFAQSVERMKRASGRVWIGTSGWNYPHWRGSFYPPGLPHKQELAYVGRCFGTVEVNGTFYSLTRPSTCEAWRQAVPARSSCSPSRAAATSRTC